MASSHVSAALLSVTLACSGGASPAEVDAQQLGADGPVSPDGSASSDGAQPQPDAAPIDPALAWGAAGSGCPRAPATLGAGQTSTSTELVTYWNADISTYPGGGASSTVRSASPATVSSGYSASVTPSADDTPAPLYLALTTLRTVVPVNRMLGSAYVPAPRVCIEGARVVSGIAGSAMVVYADDLETDSHATAPALTVVVGAGKRVILTYPAAATLANPDDVPVTVRYEQYQGYRQIALGNGGQDVYLTTQDTSTVSEVAIVVDRR